jgi:hypothetical protein
VLFHPLPEAVNGMPLGHVLSLVLTAMVRYRVGFPTPLWPSCRRLACVSYQTMHGASLRNSST